MTVRAKLTLLCILLIVLVVIAACIMVFSFAKGSALKTAYDAGLTDYEQFSRSLSAARADIRNAQELANLSYLKYIFGNIYGCQEYALQSGDASISNNTGIDAYKFLCRNGKTVTDNSEVKYGYVSVDNASYLIIGGDIYMRGESYHLALVRDITAIYAQVSALAVKCLIFCIVLLAVAALCMTFVVRNTLKPLSVLHTGVRRIAAGKYDEYIHINGRNEFSELAEGYNEMAKAVADRIDEIEKTAEDRKLLLAALSHEMRTPVTAITAYAHSLSHVRMTEEQRQEALAQINDECLRLERLSSKLMQLIALDSRTVLNFEHISSAQLIQSIEPLITPVASENSIQVTFDNPAEVHYRAETDLIVCLLTNLFDNARKAGADKIAIGLYTGLISVSDNGCGIPAEKIPKITEPFYKLDQSRNTEGFGLGLALIRRIAEAHHAELLIESETSVGTTVSIQF